MALLGVLVLYNFDMDCVCDMSVPNQHNSFMSYIVECARYVDVTYMIMHEAFDVIVVCEGIVVSLGESFPHGYHSI